MDSNTSSYLLNHTPLHSVYCHDKEDGHGSKIDLGLSLRTLQPESYHPSGNNENRDQVDWHNLRPQPKSSSFGYPRNITEDCPDETEGVQVQSKERWIYVKVNMDGFFVGRKICILDHKDYSSLAVQLEDMFGRHTISGLHLFHAGSEFSLFYKDKDEQWRIVGDVPWKEFVDSVKRLRIVPRNVVFAPPSPTFA